MKSRIFFIATALLMSTIIGNAQIKIVGDDYSSTLTGSKNYYDKDIDFDKFFPTIDKEYIGILHPYMIHKAKYEYGSVYLYKNLTGDTVYLSKSYNIDSSHICANSYVNDLPRISFCVDGLGHVVYKTMPVGYYEIAGYVFCTDNEDSIRVSYGLPINYHKRVSNDREFYSIKQMKDNILKYDTKVKASEYIRYIVFQSLSSNDKYYISLIDKLVDCCCPECRIFEDMMPLRFYSEAMSFVGKEVKIFRGDDRQIELVEDKLSDKLVKIEDNLFIVKDIVMKENQYYAVLEGEKTGSFALNIKFINGFNILKDLDDNLYSYNNISYLNDHHYLPRMGNYYNNCHSACYPFKEKTGDVHCIEFEDANKWNYSVIKRDDIAKLEQRAKIEKMQLEKEQMLKEQQRKQAKEKADAAFKIEMTAKYGTQFGEIIANRQISIDMTKEMCRDAWGVPINTYRTTTKFGQSEVWCYNYKTRVYFYNGRVVQIDD